MVIGPAFLYQLERFSRRVRQRNVHASRTHDGARRVLCVGGILPLGTAAQCKYCCAPVPFGFNARRQNQGIASQPQQLRRVSGVAEVCGGSGTWDEVWHGICFV